MFNFLRRTNRQPVASVAAAPIAVGGMDRDIPRVILDNYDTPYIPFTDTVTEQNVEEALAALIVEIGQSGYKASASIDAIQTPQERVNLIMSAMHYMEDGCGDGEYDWNADLDDEEKEEEESTYTSVKAFLLERKNIAITPQEYLDANRFSFSV